MPPVCETNKTHGKVLVSDKTGRPDSLWKRWSIEDIQTLMKLFENGEKMEVITRELDRSEYSVRCKMANLGLRCLRQKPVPRRPATEPWTVADEAILVKEWGAGTPVQMIAKKLQRTLVAVRKKRQYLQLPVRHVKAVDGEAIQEKYDNGVTMKELAAEYDISVHSVKSILKRRVYSNYQSVNAREYEIIEERYKDGCTTNCIAHRIKKSRTTVLKYIDLADLCNESQPSDELVNELLQHNLTVEQIGAKLELPRSTILRAIKRLRRPDDV